MDNLTHSLFGAMLAETGLKRTTPLATATLIIGANLPDIDGLATFGGNDFALYFRRGWTHGVLAMAILPALLAGAMLLWDRRVRRRRHPEAPPARLVPLLGLAYLSTWSHPALDWLNTYGVRLLMPFSNTWFYGDSIFIIDPWMWLLTAAAAFLAHSWSRQGKGLWLLLGLATSSLVLGVGLVPVAAKVVWSVAVVVLLAVRLLKGAPPPFVERTALVCTLVLLTYIGAMLFSSHRAERLVAEHLQREGTPLEHVAAGPIAARPFAWDVIALVPDRYLFFEVDLLAGGALRSSHPPLPRGEPGPVVQAALAAPQVRGFTQWLRFPTWRVEPTEQGWRVVLQDVRYSRLRESAIGTTVVELDKELRPR